MPPFARSSLAALVVLLIGTACTGDQNDDDGSPTDASTTTVDAASPDPLEEGLLVQVRDLRRTVATAHALLSETAAGDEGAAEDAVAALTADDRLSDGSVDVAPLFPGPDTSREETIDYGDALTRTLTAARGASGTLGSRISQVLGDPIAGDLGIWQRDAEGLLDAVDAAARAGSVEEAEEAVLDLPGEGTRALAYALLAARADDAAERREYAERGITHLDIVLRAIDDALEATGATP